MSGGAQRRRMRYPRVLAALSLFGLLLIGFAQGAHAAPGDSTASQVADIRPGLFDSAPQSLFNAGGTLLFSADDGTNDIELWMSNGGPLGPGGTELVADINSVSGPSTPQDFAEINGTVFFVANDGINDHELWKIAPPFTTPIMVEDINPTASGVLPPARLTNVNGTLFFPANDGTGKELWKSTAPYDAASTEIVKDINTATPTADS